MIETERLLLRRWTSDDAAPFHAMGQDTEVMRHLGPPMSVADCNAVIARLNKHADTGGSTFWAVERREDRAFLGFCGIKPGPADTPIADMAEIGWRLARSEWGQGYAREAAQACIARAFDGGVGQIVAITVVANARSRALMERLGMRQVMDGDFDHPAVPDGSPLKRHVLYRLDRPA